MHLAVINVIKIIISILTLESRDILNDLEKLTCVYLGECFAQFPFVLIYSSKLLFWPKNFKFAQ